MSQRPFRFGVQLRTAPTAQSWRELGKRAEGLGYSTIFMPDHFGETWSPIVPLTVLAEATSTINVGALVFDNDYRHPLLLARDCAALDLFAQGRFEFGIGAGWMTSDYVQSGIALDAPSVRIARMREGLEVIKGLWEHETFSYSGKFYQLADATCTPRPHTQKGPKVIIGGGGEKVLTAAAQMADIIGVNPNLSSGNVGKQAAQTAVKERYLERIEWIKAAAGARFDDIELQINCQFEKVTPDRDALFSAIAPGFGLTVQQAKEIPIILAGTVEQIIDDLIERREQYGFSYIVVHDLDEFAPIVAALSGK